MWYQPTICSSAGISARCRVNSAHVSCVKVSEADIQDFVRQTQEKASVNLAGTASKSQAARIITTRLREELGGVDAAEWKDWNLIKEQILQQLRDCRSSSPRELISDIFARIPKRYSPLLFATELTAAVILMLSTIQDVPEIRLLLERLKQIGLPKKMSLGVMSGIAMLLSVMQRVNRRYSAVLTTHLNRYEETLTQLNQEGRQRLGEFTREAVSILYSREKIVPG